jgi:hypothetical protein
MTKHNPDCFLSFVCTGQSGHTIIAAIVDTHKHAMISEEKQVIRKFAKKRYATVDEMYEEVIKDSTTRVQGTGSYRRRIGTIDGQWQGKYDGSIKVIGDKCGWDSIGRYKDRGAKSKELLSFESWLGVPVKVIHALRNPYDIISNWTVGKPWPLKNSIKTFEQFAHSSQKVCYDSDFPRESILQVRNEDLCRYPSDWIVEICHFLSLTPYPDYVDACASIIFKSPNRRISEVEWDSKSIEKVEKIINEYHFLDGYTIDG